MHKEAMQWINANGTDQWLSVLDIGGRNINGSARGAWPNATEYVVLDILPGDGVDIVANAANWLPNKEYDVVVCAEVFEHTPEWREICGTIFAALKPGGKAVFTMGGPGRPEHSAYDGGMKRSDEYYGNVNPFELEDALNWIGFEDVNVDQQFQPCDVRAVAYKPR